MTIGDSGVYQIAALENRLGDLESDVSSDRAKADGRHEQVMEKLGEIQSDIRSNGESQTRLTERVQSIEDKQQEHDRLLHKWMIPMGIIITIITGGSIASVLGLSLAGVL